MIKAIALDLDGTLLNSDKEVSPKTKEILTTYAKDYGVTLILSSGRTKNRMQETIDAMDLASLGGYVLESNGGAIYDLANDTQEIIRRMHKDEVEEVVHAMISLGVEVMIMGDKDVFILLPDEVKDSYYIAQNSNMEGMRNREFYFVNHVDEVTQKVTKICCFTTPEKNAEILEKLSQYPFKNEYWMGRALPEWLEVTPKDVSKGNGLRKLMERQGWNENEVVVFGDGENDLSMLEVVHYSVAMSNAMDIVKKMSNYVTDSNDEDGIYMFLKEKKEELV